MDKNNQKQKKSSFFQRIAILLCGLFLVGLTLELGLRVSGFIILSLQERQNLQSIKQKGKFRIMCLGESTTQNGYPPYLEKILNQRNTGIEFSVIDKGLACTTTVAILLKLESNLDKYHPDIVVAMMGCNDRWVMYYQDISDSWLFRHCRLYRFSQLICMHISKKLKKEDNYSVKRLARALEIPYLNQSKPFEAEEFSKNIVKLKSKDDSAYAKLGRIYRNQGKYAESETMLKKAGELNPQNDSAYAELGRLYRDQERRVEAEQVFNKAIKINPKNKFVYVELSRFYENQGRCAEAEQILNKAIEINPRNDVAYAALGQFYNDQKRLIESERAFSKAIELNPQNELAYGGLAIVYGEMGKDELSREYVEKADQLRENLDNSVMVSNYRKLKQILDQRKIRLVCVQYPMRSIQPLKKIFKDAENIIFVDNEKIFKDAVRESRYDEYFRDNFGGDFGHCTAKGDQLLAQNIANVILEEVFK